MDEMGLNLKETDFYQEIAAELAPNETLLREIEDIDQAVGTNKYWKFGIITQEVHRLNKNTFIITDTSDGWTEAQVSLHILKKLLSGEYSLNQLQFN